MKKSIIGLQSINRFFKNWWLYGKFLIFSIFVNSIDTDYRLIIDQDSIIDFNR